MQQGKIWAIGVILTFVLLISSGCKADRSLPGQSVDRAVPSVVPTTAPSATPANLPTMQAEGILRHIRALAQPRYSSAERQKARDYITRTLIQYGWKVTPQTFEQGINLIADRPDASSRTDTLLLVAHYDSVAPSPGADDNASAVAVILEIARLLDDRSSKRQLKLVFFDQEERGLLGSFAFAANPDNLKHLAGVINLEMLGYACYTTGCQTYPENLPIRPPTDRGDFLAVVGDQEHLPLLEAFQTVSRSASLPLLTLPIPFKGLLTPDILRSDHAAFWANNIGAVMVTDTANFRNPHYHQASDTPETLDRPFLEQSAQLVLNAVSVLLNQSNSLVTESMPSPSP